MLIAIYEDDKQQRIEIPIAEVQGKHFLITERGEHADIENMLEDVYLGTLRYIDTTERASPLPRPVNHELRAAVAKFKTLYNSSFRSGDEEQAFLASHKQIQAALNNDFANATIEQLGDWSNLVKESVPAEEFSRYELTEKFTPPQCGDIRLDAVIQPWTMESGDQTWSASCYKCGAKLANVKASTILRMRRDGKTFQCGQPCRPKGVR